MGGASSAIRSLLRGITKKGGAFILPTVAATRQIPKNFFHFHPVTPTLTPNPLAFPKDLVDDLYGLDEFVFVADAQVVLAEGIP